MKFHDYTISSFRGVVHRTKNINGVTDGHTTDAELLDIGRVQGNILLPEIVGEYRTRRWTRGRRKLSIYMIKFK